MEVWKIDGLESEEVLVVAVIRQAVEDYWQLENWEKGAREAVETRKETYFNTLADYGRDAKRFLFSKRLEHFLNQYHLNLNPEYIRRKANGG